MSSNKLCRDCEFDSLNYDYYSYGPAQLLVNKVMHSAYNVLTVLY